MKYQRPEWSAVTNLDPPSRWAVLADQISSVERIWPLTCSPRPAPKPPGTSVTPCSTCRPRPGAEQADHWEDDGTGTWTRRLAMSTRSVKRPGADSSVYVDGVQSTDGTEILATYPLLMRASSQVG